jgi:hypothetical protein
MFNYFVRHDHIVEDSAAENAQCFFSGQRRKPFIGHGLKLERRFSLLKFQTYAAQTVLHFSPRRIRAEKEAPSAKPAISELRRAQAYSVEFTSIISLLAVYPSKAWEKINQISRHTSCGSGCRICSRSS